MRRSLLKLPLLALAGLAGKVATAEAASLAFGVITTTTVAETQAAWEPFFAAMRQSTGLDVRGVYHATYEEAVDAVVSNLVQLAWVSNKAALDCIERTNVEVFAQLVDSAGSPGYRSIIVTRRDSGLTSIDQLLNRPRTWRFAMGEPSSTSGSVMLQYALFVPRSIKPEEHFLSLRRGTHAQTLAAVLGGQVHAGAYNTEELLRLREHAPSQAQQLRILWESALIPKDPLLWRRDLPLSVRKRIADYIFGVGKTLDEKLMLKRMFDLAGFKRSSNQQLKFVLDIDDFKQRSEVLLDAKLGEALKNERLADLRERYARLSRAVQADADMPR
ncbi:phosphate/phosphite/phosphonate ABC transporter substrate-binding protein [Methylibium sp.]|uniref:phosphate/phosphite/phosphonate ABC transporter substrate-binding protein n=1 Tax=Methylibium sp. TaxID=2067992 RepID=UPI003D105D59